MIVIFNTNSKKNQIILICVGIVLAAALIAAGVWGYQTFLADDGLILNNVFVADVNIGGKTREEAKTLVQRQTDLTYPYEDMVVCFPDEELRLSPEDTGVALDIDRLIDDAWNYGRSGTHEENQAIRDAAPTTAHHLELSDYLSVDTAYIQAQLDAYEQAHTASFTESSVTVEGERPALDADGYDPEALCQTILVYTGTPERSVTMDGVLDLILAAYGANEFLVEVDVDLQETLPAAVDLEPLYTEHYIAPVDASVNKSDFSLIPETYGYDFDLEAAQALLAEAEYGQTIEIPFRYVTPEVVSSELTSEDGLLFQDVLAKYTTYYVNEINRATNISLAAKAINNKVLMPGEKFDYNTTVGKRTAEKGYRPANAYVNGKTVQSIGGGICQVSSTLYYCTLLADLKINTRTAHGFVSSYMPLGMDATVSWGGPHFAFTNNTGYPLRIEAYASGGALTVKLVGTNTKDYYIKMEYEVLSTTEPKTEYKEMTAKEAKEAGYQDGEVIQTAYTGKKVETFKCKYDAETDKLISRTYEATSNYKSRNKIIVKIVAEATEKPTDPPTKPTDPPTKPTDPPTQPTEPPTQPTEPKPTDPPVEETDPPVEETDPPVDETTPAPTDESPGGEG